MSIELINLTLDWEFDTPIEKLIALSLAKHANEKEGNQFWPKLETIARHAQCNEKTVRRTLKKFEDTGIIILTAKKGGHKPNKYKHTSEWRTRAEENSRKLRPQQPPAKIIHITPERKKELWGEGNWTPAQTNGMQHVSKTPDDILAEMHDGPAKRQLLEMLSNIRKKEPTQ